MSSSDYRRTLTIPVVAIWFGIIPFFHVFPSLAAGPVTTNIIRHSDIDMLSWYPPGQHTVNPDDFRKWGVTLVTWGLDSIFTRTQNVPQPLSELVKAASDSGVRSYLANLDMCSAQPWNLAKDAELREAIARDFDGNGLVVPWFPAVVDGVPAYWGCLNHPVYQENVRQRIRDGAAAGCKGLHVDCANMMTGILGRYGGCYCRYCVEGFKKQVLQKYSRQQLSDMGIDEIESWDFPAQVKRIAGTAEQLPKAISSGRVEKHIPLFRDYRAFVAQSNMNWLKELAALTKQLGGPDTGYSVNGGSVDRWLALSSFADFFTCEVRHEPKEGRIPSRVIGLYRSAESMGKLLSVTAGTVQDWLYPAKGGMDNLVAMWVAFAYANGHLFIVPNNVWCYSEEKGEHAYQGPEEVFLPLYRFIRRNESLLDDYDPIEQIGVVYRSGRSIEVAGGDDAPRRKWVDPFSELCDELVEAHYPFGVVFPGGAGQKYKFSVRDLERFERVVIPEGVALHGKDKEVLESLKRTGRAVPWTDSESALREIEPLVRISKGKRIWVLPRKNKKDPTAPIVCHLLNPCYDAKRDSMIEQTNIVISLRSDLSNRRLSQAVLYTPGEEPQKLSLSPTGKRLEVTLPKLILWGMLSLQ